MPAFLARLLGRGTAPKIEPRLDEAVARRLEAAGKVPDRVEAVPAEPVRIPAKPELAGFLGMIRFELTLDAAGRVTGVALDGAPHPHRPALEAWARAWTFTPARLDGATHPCRMVYEVHWS